MIPHIVDGLHYHLPFYREVFKSESMADDAMLSWTVFRSPNGFCDQRFTNLSKERMADGWAVTINLEGARD